MYKSLYKWLYITISIAGGFVAMLGTKQQNNSILVERHKGLTIVINTDLPKFQIVKKLVVMDWNKPHKFRRCRKMLRLAPQTVLKTVVLMMSR